MEIIKGNMCDLSMLVEGSFDLILNPPSLMYVPDPIEVFRECSKVLKPGGELIIMA
ncbi:MAG: methyltransferase domain-containing protein, partial [Clostridia bacterium]|nr:methyltransferase domain-containing protein [Clostridia bacterium]